MKNVRIVLLTGILILLANVLSAQTIDLVNVNFATTCGVPPSGWNIENVDGSCTWRCSDGGITQNNHSSQGCTNAANDWLITPALSLNNYRNEVLVYTTTSQYSGGGLAVKYSTNYPGTGNPASYTWTTLIATSVVGSSGNINLSAINGSSVYIAFQYTSTGNATNQAARWTITSVIIKGDQSVVIENPTHRNITPSSAILGAQLTNEGGLTVTERGILWSTTTNPTLVTPNTTKVQRQGGLGVYDTLATGLPTGSLIYYRGYARTTGGLEFYSPVSSFYTLADEPAQHTTSFAASAIGSNAIVLKWNEVSTAQGYIILQKTGSIPTAAPQDGISYTEGSSLNDATVARVINLNAIETDTIRDLLAGTRYYFTLIPIGVNVTQNAATYNYLTTPVIPSANDSTTGVPTSYFSDIAGVVGSESNFISSVENTLAINANTEGTQVWKLALRDGGLLMNDADTLPTIVTSFRLSPATYNTASWQTMIQSVALFDDSTGSKIGTASVLPNGIQFTGLNLISADNNFRTVSVRLSLNKNTVLPEQTIFQFTVIDTTVKTQSAVFSSQLGSFAIQSIASKNSIGVSATRIRIVTQPPSLVEVGVPISNVITELVDVWNNPDIDTVLTVQASSTWNNLGNGSYLASVTNGRAVFSHMIFNKPTGADTILFESGSLIPAKSIRVKVKNSSFSDIIASSDFVYARSIPYINYLDSINLTHANTFPVFGLTIRDGAAQMNDADSAATLITAIKLSVTNFNQIKTLALFDSSNNNLAEVLVTGATVDFANLNVTTNDNGLNKLIVRATFKKVVTDGSRLQFKITQVSYKNDTLSSQLAVADGGGAISSTVSYENKINVIADKLEVIGQPSLSYANEVVFPATKIRATDSLGNIDMEGRVIYAQALSGTLDVGSVAQIALSPVNGLAEFTKIVYADTVTRTQLKFTDGILTVLTDTFDVVHPVWFRSVKSGSWDSLSTWEYSTDKGQTWLDSAALVPDAVKHGKIIISQGHIVTVGGAVGETFKIDETIIEAGAVLITPSLPGKTLEVMNGRDEDLIIYGTLKHTNGTSVNGIINQSGSIVTVMAGGMIELATNGYAANWAANPLIVFKNNAVYYHHTTQTNAITIGEYFASTPENETPVFRFGSSYNFRSALGEQLIINGVTEVDPFVTVIFSGFGSNTFKNGFWGDGNISFTESCFNTITSNASISGNGIIRINDNATVEFGQPSVVTVTGNKTIHTNNNRKLMIAGYFNSNTNTINGNAGVELTGNAWFVTAHTQGVKGAFSGTGTLLVSENATIEFNSTNYQQEIKLPEAINIAKLIVSNPYGVSLTNLLHISKSLDLAEGSIIVSGEGVLSLAEETAFINYNSNKFINGKVRININEQAFLPIGKNQIYAPTTIKNKQNDSSVYEIEYFDTLHAVASVGALKSVLPNDSWIVSKIIGNTTAKFIFTHHAVLGTGENLSDLRIASLTNNIYQSVGPVNRNATQASIETNYIEPSGVFAVAIDQPCTTPVLPVVVNDTICYGTTALLKASTASSLAWFASANDETIIFNGNNITTGPLFSDTAFYVENRQLSCASSRVKLNIIVINTLNKPTIANNTMLVCKNNQAILSAAGSQLLWFADERLTNNVASGSTFLSGAITNDTTFYVVSSQNGCISTAGQITVFAKANPAKPFIKDVTTCKGSTALLSASTNASTINWYTSLIATTAFNTTNSISIQNVMRDTTFYVVAKEGECESERVGVSINVVDVPAAPVIDELGVACKGSAVTLHANGTNNIRWFLSDVDTLPVHIGNSYTTEPLSRNTLFFVDASNGICKSALLSFPVSVIQLPTVSGIRTLKYVRQYDSIAVSTESNGADEYSWNFGNDAEPSLAVGAGPHYVKWNTAGTHVIHLSVSNKLGAFSCSKEFDTTISVVPLTGITELESSIISNVYPNPTNALLTINATFKSAEKAKVYLTDGLGKTVWMDLPEGISKNYTTQVDVNTLSDGVYMLFIEAGEARVIQKVVISK